MNKPTLKQMRAAAFGLALALAGSARAADFVPIALTSDSFNRDMVVEKGGPTPLIAGGATTASMDGGIGNTGNAWNEQGYFDSDPTVGLPPAGSTINTNNHQFTFASSYTANNAIMLDVGHFTNATWTVTTPAAYGALSFLTSGGNGGAQFRYTAHHLDGTTETGVTNSADWFNVSQNIAWIANGRVDAQSFALNNYASQNPRLYSIDVPLSGSSSPITSIDIQYVGGNASGHSCIMAISGAATLAGPYTPILGTGYTADIVVEATAPKRWDLSAPAVSPTVATMDNGDANTGNTWFEQGYYAPSNTLGLATAGTTITNPAATDHRYTMPTDYTREDAVMLDTTITTATITPATPQAFASLSFLGAAAAGASGVQALIHHQDGSVETNNITFPDWFGASPTVWDANGRIDRTSGIFNTINGGNPRLAGLDIGLKDSSSPITSIDFNFTRTDGGRVAIFAVSGSTSEIPPAFTLQPQSVVTNTGATVVFSAAASSSTTPTYQWQKETGGVFTDITGETGAQLTLTGVTETSEGRYRVIASNTSGTATSGAATLTIISTLPKVTTPTDPITLYQPNGGSTPGAETVDHAIDNTTSKYLNFGANGGAPFRGPVGFVVVPAKGRTIVTVMRLYTANDTVGRDPANYILEGSTDNGLTWTLISSNSISLPDARNAGALALDPTNQAMTQVRFNNTASYSSYRWSVTQVKDPNANSMQIGEVELLGTVDNTGYPIITSEPTDVNVYEGGSATLSVTATGTPAPTYQWMKDGVNLANGGNISGATSPNLVINPASFSDAGAYSVLVANSLDSISSFPAHLLVVSTNTDVTFVTDTITGFGDQSGLYADATNAINAIDNTTAKWVNGGSGFSAAAGFPPFSGPVGLIVSPTVGTGIPSYTVLKGLRIYTADGNPERDPGDYVLEGSNDDGATWHTISAGTLDLPQARNDNSTGTAIDPLTLQMQEVLFPNNAAYLTYRITFNHTRNDQTASSLQFADMELLGVEASGPSPVITISASGGAGGNITITSSMAGTLQSTTALGPNAQWTNEGPISGSVTITPSPAVPAKFFRVVVP